MISKLGYFLRQRGFQMAFVFLAYDILSSYLPLELHQGFYTISLFIKDILLWMMPLTVAFFIAYTLQSFNSKAPLFLAALLLFETVSNFLSVWYAYGSASFLDSSISSLNPTIFQHDFQPLWRLPFQKPGWWAVSRGVVMGCVLGLVGGLLPNSLVKDYLQDALTRCKNFFEFILTKVFSRLIPLFVLGFLAYIYQTKMIEHMVSHYVQVVLWLIVVLVIYLSFLFLLSVNFSPKKAWKAFRNLMPASSFALMSGCSLSTMPLTIQGAGKNMKNPELAKAIIPATTNIQQIGDVVTNAFLCFIIYRSFYGHNPDMLMWFNFSLVFVMARFATAAVLGGAIFIMIPIYEQNLHFHGEMITIILALNVILDPLVTASNVLGNGVLSRIFEKLWEKAHHA